MGCTGFSSGGICSNEFAYIVLSCLVPHFFGFIEYNLLEQTADGKDWLVSMECFWRPHGPTYRFIWTVLYTGTGYAAYLVLVTAGGWHAGTEICMNMWLLMTLNNMHWGHLMFKVRRLELCMANRTVALFLTLFTARLFYCHSRQAAYFMYGYFMWVALSWAHNYDLWKKNPLHRWKWKTRISEIPRGRKKKNTKKHASLRTKKKGYICISLHLREKMLKFTYVLRSIYYKCTIQTKLHDMRSSTLYTGYIFMYICCFFYFRSCT